MCIRDSRALVAVPASIATVPRLSLLRGGATGGSGRTAVTLAMPCREQRLLRGVVAAPIALSPPDNKSDVRYRRAHVTRREIRTAPRDRSHAGTKRGLSLIHISEPTRP